MANIFLNDIPKRSEKPRNEGITMVMDKGLSVREIEDFLSVSHPYVDVVKIGFGTSYVTPNLDEKIQAYKDLGISCYFGGTLFEAFVIRNQFEDYMRVIDKYQMPYAEVSDGSFAMEHTEKLEYIRKLSEITTVISEVGSKDNDHIIPPYKWLELMNLELEAGSWKVIAEARESGTTGIYMGSGKVRSGLIDEILTKIPHQNIIWEAPQKSQQVFFVQKLGANVNVGNIAPREVIPLETLRVGLRSDTFFQFIEEDKK